MPFSALIAWDRGRNAVRSFRADRIARARVLDEAFATRPLADFREAAEGSDAITP